jgi:hypothetical protein
MSDKDKAQGMKSAYELALERLDATGIDRPKEGGLSDDLKTRIADERSKAEAKLAELEILHRDRLKTLADPTAREQEEEDHRLERLRIEDKRDRAIDKLRGE